MNIDKEKLTQEVIKLKNGDGKAFENIYNMTNQASYFTVLKIVKNEEDAQDVLQECYITLLDKIGTLDDPSAFTTWFNRIIANKSRNYLRDMHPERYTDAYFTDDQGEESSAFDSIEDTDENFIPEASAESAELQREVMKMIENLSDEKRSVVILYYYNNLTTRDIAESLGVNENTVKSRLVQAKKDLAKSVKEYESKNGKLLGVAPMPIIIWALKSAATTTAMSSGAAASTLAAVTAGTAVGAGAAAAGTGAAVSGGTGVAAKIIAGVVAVAIVGGGTIAGTKAVQNAKKNKEKEQTTVSEKVDDSTERTIPDKTKAEEKNTDYEDIVIPEDKLVDTVFEEEDLGYGVTLRKVSYIYDTPNGRVVKEGKPVIYRNNYNADYDDLMSMSSQNSSKYSADINSTISKINTARANNGAKPLVTDSKLSEQASVRATEIAMSGKISPIRPDGTNYTSIFDKNGYSSGTRKELRAWRCNSPEDAIKKWQSDGALLDTSIEKIGIGIAKDPETDDCIYVAHLYSDKESEESEDPSLSDKMADSWNSNIDDIDASNDEAINKINEAREIIADIPIIGDVLTYDFHNDAFMMLLQSASEKLTETINDLFDGV